MSGEESSLLELDWSEESDLVEFLDDVFGLVEFALAAGSLALAKVVAVFPSRMIWIWFGIGEGEDTSALNSSKFSRPLPDVSECNLRVPGNRICGNREVFLVAINGCALQ